MRYFYDLHLHSALSPCGDEDMTPNNIVNMALLKGLDIIALSDHNSAGNLRAVAKAAGSRLLVIPAIEVESAEEVHIVCYFPSVDRAEQFSEELKAQLPPIENRPDIFGRQLDLNEQDVVTGEEHQLLVCASGLSIEQVFSLTANYGGASVPAHIDRSSSSILSNLGFIPPDLPVSALEITAKGRAELEQKYAGFRILTNSDAHYLEDIAEPEFSLDLEEKSIDCFLHYLWGK